MANNVVDGLNQGLNQEATKRLDTKKQTLDDAYAEPMNFLEIDVVDPITHGISKQRYTDYEIRLKVGICLILSNGFSKFNFFFFLKKKISDQSTCL